VSPGRILAVVPVKPLSTAKSRLGRSLDQARRSELAAAMLMDVLAALAGVEGLAGFAVATPDSVAAGIGTALGARVFPDAPSADLNSALADAARALAGEGLDGILILPADIPAVTSGDLRALVEGHPHGPAVSIVPSHDGDGTSALLCSPPTLMNPAFGPGSFAAHVDAARRRGVPCVVRQLARIAQDVDHPGDLEAVLRLGIGPRTEAVMGGWRKGVASD
jgi:2-phospho-L-lactate guanylyltransferase